MLFSGTVLSLLLYKLVQEPVEISFIQRIEFMIKKQLKWYQHFKTEKVDYWIIFRWIQPFFKDLEKCK